MNLGSTISRLLGGRGAFGRGARTQIGEGVRVLGRIWVHGGGSLRLGNRVRLDARRGPIELHVAEGAELVLEDDVVVEGGTSIEATESVRLGRSCHVGAWVKILDNHFHLPSDQHSRPPPAPVLVGEGVVIGDRCIILPGTRLGDHVRLCPGVVVSRRVPAGAILEGFPPRRVSGGVQV